MYHQSKYLRDTSGPSFLFSDNSHTQTGRIWIALINISWKHISSQYHPWIVSIRCLITHTHSTSILPHRLHTYTDCPITAVGTTFMKRKEVFLHNIMLKNELDMNEAWDLSAIMLLLCLFIIILQSEDLLHAQTLGAGSSAHLQELANTNPFQFILLHSIINFLTLGEKFLQDPVNIEFANVFF